MSLALLALLVAAAGMPAATASAVPDAIDACLERLDRGLDVGYERIAERCPQLTPALARSEWGPWLPRDWNQSGNLLSAAGLRELRTLLERAPAAGGRAPRVERVAAVLAAFAQPDTARAGWWTRFKLWLREVLTPRPQASERGWLRRLLASIAPSDDVLAGIAWGALALVVALAAIVIANELRVAGLLRVSRQSRAPPRRAARPAQGSAFEALAHAGGLEQPALLLELIASRLAELERLPPSGALTVKELMRAAALPRESDRGRLRELAQVSERVRFSDRALTPAALAAALASGRELLATLTVPAAAPAQAAG
jgi:hypothetical protein